MMGISIPNTEVGSGILTTMLVTEELAVPVPPLLFSIRTATDW